jgi:hypothetical protein
MEFVFGGCWDAAYFGGAKVAMMLSESIRFD